MTTPWRKLIDADRKFRGQLYDETARRLRTDPGYIEKDFWVCVVLHALYKELPASHPKLLFKGGTSLSKGFDLIKRFSEDIDIVVFREDLGFTGEGDPTNRAVDLSGKKRERLFDELKAKCAEYVHGRLAPDLGALLAGTGCTIRPDPKDPDQQTLLVEYPEVVDNAKPGYVEPKVKIECGARSALDPSTSIDVTAYVAGDLDPSWDLSVRGVRTIKPARTYWEKLLILHGIHYGFEAGKWKPSDRDRTSRHLYDAAMISETPVHREAIQDAALWQDVREHNLIAFRQSWKRFDQAVRGSMRVVPQPDVRSELEKDYRAMGRMLLGDAPPFEWIIDRLRAVEAEINL